MTEILQSIVKWFKERSASPLYGTFILSVILWNWKFFYILFWQSENKLLFPRIEYVQKLILEQQNLFEHILYFLILPIFSTFVILWWLPILSNLVYKKHIYFFYKRRLIMDDARLDYEKRESATLNSISSIKKSLALVKKEIEKNTTKEERWDQDYEELKKLDFAHKFSKIIESYYKRHGDIVEHAEYNGGVVFEIPEDILAYTHSNEMIIIDQSTNKIDMTEKGKYIIHKFLSDPKKPIDIPF